MSVYHERMKIRRMALIAVFAALSYVLMLVVHVPVGGFLTLDVKDVFITICGLCFGPLAALALAVLVPLMEFLTVSETGLYGLIMNVAGSVAFSVVVSLIYKHKKSFSGALLGLLSGVCSMTAVMMLLNLLVTPYYFGIAVGTVRDMIPTLLLPFNLVKGALNAGCVSLLYKPLSGILQRFGFLPASEHAFRFDRKTLLMTLLAVLLIAASLLIVFLVLR